MFALIGPYVLFDFCRCNPIIALILGVLFKRFGMPTTMPTSLEPSIYTIFHCRSLSFSFFFFTLFPFLFLCGFHAIQSLFQEEKNTCRAVQTDRIHFFLPRPSFYHNSHQNERNIQCLTSIGFTQHSCRTTKFINFQCVFVQCTLKFSIFFLLFKAKVRIIFQNHQLSQIHSHI